MELYSATWDALAFDFPETLEEATHKKPATGKESNKSVYNVSFYGG